MDNTSTIVFGGTGFIGRHLCRFLEERGHVVRSLGSKDCDLTDADAVQNLLDGYGDGINVVLCSSIGRLTDDSFDSFGKNVGMAYHVARAAAQCRARSLVYLSSADVYGPAPAPLITEATLPQPNSYYGASKLAAEKMIQVASGDVPATILRLPGIFGPNETDGSIVSLFLRKAAAGETITLSGGGKILRDYVYVQDLCGIMEELLMEPQSGLFNVATGNSRTLYDIAAAAFRALGIPPQIVVEESREGRGNDLAYDNQALMRRLPGFSFTPLDEAVAACAEAYR